MIRCTREEDVWNNYFVTLADNLEPIYFSDDDGDENEYDVESYSDNVGGLARHEES